MEIPTIRGLVHRSVLYGGDTSVKGWDRCLIFGVESFQGESPCFNVLLENGGVFSHVPPHLLSARRSEPDLLYALNELSWPCPVDDNPIVDVYKVLRGPCHVKVGQEVVRGEYLFSLAWDQENLHAVRLSTGQLALRPQYRILFGGEKQWPTDWKPLKAKWWI